MKAKICEIYKTVMGEGRFTGKPCLLVRFVGCNLNCSYCDTKYSLKDGREIEVNQLIEIIENNLTADEKLLLTGGEPLLQPDIIHKIIDKSIHPENIVLETNGSIDFESKKTNFLMAGKALEICVNMDIKIRGKNDSNNRFPVYYCDIIEANLGLLGDSDDVKLVINSNDDWIYVKENLLEFIQINEYPQYYLSHTENFPLKKLWELFVEEERLHLDNIQIQTQLHKVAFKNGAKEGEIRRII